MQNDPVKDGTEKKMRCDWKPGHFTGRRDVAQGLGIMVSLRKQDGVASQFGTLNSSISKMGKQNCNREAKRMALYRI